MREIWGFLMMQKASDAENAKLLVVIDRLNATVSRLVERRDVWIERCGALESEVEKLITVNAQLAARLDRFEPAPVLMEHMSGDAAGEG